jgi:EmrB/QacA subfamily drug resistance transporter
LLSQANAGASGVERPGQHWRVVATVCVGAFMAALDASIVTVAIPTLHVFFHTAVATVEWVSIAYLLTLSSLLTAFGKVADQLGRARMYRTGFIIFIVGSALCGIAPSVLFLIVARVLQAAGAAFLQANSVALITHYTPAEERGRAIGFQGAAQAIGLSVGPAVGGALLAAFSWRALFYVNVPIGILGTILAGMFLPRDTRGQAVRFDYLGSALLALFLLAFLWALSTGYEVGWTSPSIITAWGVALLALFGFLLRERRFPEPVLDLTLFRRPRFTFGNLSGLLSYTLMYGVLFLTPFALERVLGLAPATVGLTLTAVPLAMSVTSPVAGGLADRHGPRLLTTLGMLLGGVGSAVIGLSTLSRDMPLLLVGLVLVGVGMGLFTPPNNSSVMGTASRDRLGMVGGFLNMTRSAGMSIGVALSGTIFAGILLAHAHSESLPLRAWATTAGALWPAYAAVGAAAIVAALVSWFSPEHTSGGGGGAEFMPFGE